MAETSPKGQKTLGKEEIAHYEQFLLFLQCCQDLFWETLKNKGLLGKGLHFDVRNCTYFWTWLPPSHHVQVYWLITRRFWLSMSQKGTLAKRGLNASVCCTILFPNDKFFRLFQTERVCRRPFQAWWKWQMVLKTDRKHCGKWSSYLLQAFSPFPSVFKTPVLKTRKNQGLFGKGL